jgi:NADPH-dependent 2,4-dienoyl-CoA reductase/sulfur reductase-like enzyme/peroxiredoxin family protein/TusA-related sulfurtransferase/rhodanese-related sulfurtransferase
MGKKVLIVGGVAGGASTAARLRRLDETAEIILFERGEYISYANCGLPYHVGNVIKSRDSLLLQTPEGMKAKFRLDVRTRQEVTAIDRENKAVIVQDLSNNIRYTETYDVLVIATGSSPLTPPIPGRESSRVMTLWTVPDTDRIRTFIKENNAASAVVVGGGFIGLEMAENLHHAGLDVTIAEMLDQVMAPLDYEMAQLLHEHLEESGVHLCLSDGVAFFEDTVGGITVKLKSGKEIKTDLVILSIGVKPNSALAKDAGLQISAAGGIVTDSHMRTGDANIYAVGDAVEVEDFIFKGRTMIPLAGPANRQGRIAADNIAGTQSEYRGTQGTAIAKVFDLTAAATGVNEKALKKQGFAKGKDYQALIITQNSHAGYYPGATPLTMKLLFAGDGSKIFGAQIVGRDGVDKRIDVIATAIRLNASVLDLKDLELAYAPPYSSAKDPVNMAGFVAENILLGRAALADWDALEQEGNEGRTVLDVREEAERMVYEVPNSKHIPLGQLRDRLNELDRSKEVVVFCAIGVRAYNAARILKEHGFTNVNVYPGGTKFYVSTHYQNKEASAMRKSAAVSDSGHQSVEDVAVASMRLDCSGLQCPGPIMKVFETMKGLKDGDVIEVSANDPGFARDIVSWCRRTNNTLVQNTRRGNEYVALVKKGSSAAPAQVTSRGAEGKTIIVFSGDLDKVLASFIIANGAAAMGRPVTMFFTFWGLNVLRKGNKQKVQKPFIEAMFGGMMPRGVNKLKLSKMNMAGMGTAMMKMVMRQKNVDSLEELMKKAMQSGIKLVACTMSMDVMGIRKEELIDGVELGGVGAYLGDAEESNVNLFI